MNTQAFTGLAVFSLLLIAVVVTTVFAIRGMALRRRMMCIVATVIFCIGILGVNLIQAKMVEIRDQQELIDNVPLREAPPVVAFTTIALGGFRGLLADLLFLRSEAMKEREQYFEMVQLADWIVKLQPRFTGAIAFLAWNMSYNVSVNFTSHEDRWRWVQRGIELIRDQGLLYNPNDPILYQELGWIYQHKLGNILDDAHNFYKAQLAREMERVTNQTYPIDWQRFADTPANQEALVAALGEATWTTLRQLLDDYYQTRSSNDLPNANLLKLELYLRTNRLYPDGLVDKLQAKALFVTVDNYLRARWLREGYRLDPVVLLELTAKYGELDWRLPEAHAIYWASLGIKHAPGGQNLKCERMIFQSLANSFRSGRLLYIDRGGRPVVTSNLAVAEGARQAYLWSAAQNENNRSIMSGYENWLKDAIVTLFVNGRGRQANQFYEHLRESFPGNPAYTSKPLQQFALDELGKDISGRSMEQVQSIINDLVMRHFREIAIGDLESAALTAQLAEHIHAIYMRDRELGKRSTERVRILGPTDPGLQQRAVLEVALSLPEPELENLKAITGITDEILQQLYQFYSQPAPSSENPQQP